MTLQPPTCTHSQAYLAAPQTTTCRSKQWHWLRGCCTARQEQTSAEQEQAERLARMMADPAGKELLLPWWIKPSAAIILTASPISSVTCCTSTVLHTIWTGGNGWRSLLGVP